MTGMSTPPDRPVAARPGAIGTWVAGVPAPQGSKRALRAGSRITLVESSKRVRPWRKAVSDAFRAELRGLTAGTGGAGMAPWAFPAGAVEVRIDFVLYRPKATPKRSATPQAVKKPDLDKLVRAVLDALTTANVYADDSQVVSLVVTKRIAELGEQTGAQIVVGPTALRPSTASVALMAAAVNRARKAMD